MSHSRVRNLLATKLAEYATTKGIRVSYENYKLYPNVDETYLETCTLPAPTITRTLSGDHKEFLGVYQIKIIVGSGVATALSDQIVEELQTAFPVDSTYVDVSGFTVQVISPVSIAQGKVQDGKWVIPCSLEYRADTF